MSQVANQSRTISSRRALYHTMRTLENRLGAAQEALKQQYLVLLRTANALHLDPHLGLLHAAADFLNQPLDPPTLRLQQRLNYALASLGTGFRRRAPTSLRLDILEFADRLGAVCQHCHQLSARLHLAQRLVGFLPGQPHWRQPRYLQLALVNPEAVWITMLLRERQSLTRQATDFALSQSCRARLTICRNWLDLLSPSLPAERLAEFKTFLAALEDQTGSPPGPNSAQVLAAHRQLDLLTEQINCQIAEIISLPSS